jgi:YD repeat-containing protein
MCRRVGLRSSLRIALLCSIGIALLAAPCVSMFVSAMGQGRGPRTPPPRPGKPEGTFPDLAEVKNESLIEREPPAPIPSTIRSQRNSGKPWDGRRVGDPEPPADHARGQTQRAHARRRMRVRPLLYEDQFIQNFFNIALVRSATYEETLYWNYQFRAAYNETAASLKLAAIELGRTLFETAAYAARGRDAHGYVYDLYKTYLMREPDTGGWTTWEGLVSSHGREYVRRGFEESGEFANLLSSITLSGASSATASSLISARVEPRNQPGNGLLTRDAAWSVPLLSLPGRNGLDLGLALSYSSMVWTRSGPYLYFDEDNGFPSPGFRLGFPTVQRKAFDAQVGRKAYLLITAGGKRVELRQVGTSNIYDAADSSYLRLTENGSTLLVHSTDGTKLSFSEISGEYRCVEIKDRNGNYITVNNNALGRISSITDTLGRVINFNYDGNANLISITQAWNGQPAHQWASFGWGTRNLQSSFSGVALVGTANSTPVLTQVALNDTSYFTFDYTNSLQVSVIRKYFGTAERNATSFTYETPGSDAPRLVSSSVSAQNWTGVNGVPAQVTTQYGVAADGACVLTAPDGTVYREYYGSGWQRGLTTRSEVRVGQTLQKWTTTTWTQDDTSVSYEVNPRVTETNVYDANQNRRRTTIDYGAYAAYGLPYAVHEYASNGETEIRQTVTDYNISQACLDRRIIGLVAEVQLRNGSGQAFTKTTYSYDDPARLHGVPAAATQHDVNYNLSLTARGNVTAVSRWDVNDINNAAKKLTSYTDYYNTGTPIATTDPAGHPTSITYGDSFSDNVSRNTFAYPTTITDAGNFSSFVQYNFDFGATTRTQSPAPAGQLQGAIQTMSYNSLGQLERITTTNNNAYKRFWYGADYTASYAAVNNVADEAYAVAVIDGLGRVIGAVSNHPGSYGGYSLVNTIYDQMGRARKVSNPTEVNSSWVPKGDDETGIYYTQQTYDWKGRPLVTTNPDGTTKEASYAGCGCAGGEVVTSQDEVGRRQKIYSDVFGREVKMEVFDWNGNPYSTRTTAYNARDQIEEVRQYQGLESSNIYQRITKIYDGYGRLANEKHPIQTSGTLYTYNADSQPLTVTDARGVTQTFTYNSRDLPTMIGYSGGAALSSVSLAYDGARNRTLMSDGTGSRTYQYNQLSQLTSETRQFTGLSGNYTLSYEYNLAGALKAFTDHVGSRVDYVFNTAGRLTAVNGSGTHSVPAYASNLAYRASGAIKDFDYGNGVHQHLNFNSRLQNTSLTLSLGASNSTWSFAYYGDGKLQKITDSNNPVFDRAFVYDHVGRLQEARTGSEARGGTTADGPFKQTYSYDVWENTTSLTNRVWTETPVTHAASFTNNRKASWTYDNEGNLLSNADASFSYDAAGHQNQFTANVFIGGWPTSYPVQSVLEVTQTFDGNSTPVKKTTVNRWEDFVGGEYRIQEATESVYYLRSTALGGQVVAELDATGHKQRGYVFAGGMRLATQHVWNSGSEVAWVSMSPASGSEYMPSSYFLGRTELDPLGNDVTYAPQPDVVLEPVFYNPKFDQMPLEIEGGPSEEYEKANAEWADLMERTFQNIYDAGRARQLWQSGRRSAAMAILLENPNIGIEYRIISKGEVTESGSHFGQAAAYFLLGLATAETTGTPVPQNTMDGLLQQGKAELISRINERKTCADVFGGKEKALKALSQLKFKPGSLQREGIMAIRDNNVTVDTTRFVESGQTLALALNISKSTVQGYPSTSYDLMTLNLSGKEFAAFVIGHELGHKRKIYGEYDIDGSSVFSNLAAGANNEKIRAACFSEFEPQPLR